MNDTSGNLTVAAVHQFRSARSQAKIEQIKAALTGKSADLLSYEDVRGKIHARETNKRELKDIPLDAIVGSVGRYKDFTRHFFPLVEGDEVRWVRVYTLTGSLEGLPPIEVYQIGEVYFVRDGNHRVSVARDLESTHIEAYVTQVETPVMLQPDIQPDELISKERYAHFLDRTHLDKTFPDLDLSMSAAGNYRVLEQQIGVHQHWVKEHKAEDISFIEAAVRWYTFIYWPVIQIIRRRGMMRDFPNRTETDLYVWIDKHRHELAGELGWSVDTETAAADLVDKQTQGPMQRLGQKFRSALTPAVLEAGPVVGEWRESWQAAHNNQKLFSHILVAIDGQDTGWHALQEAACVAKREQSTVFGLHLVDTPQAVNSEVALAVQVEFKRRCHEAGITGEITLTTGPITGTICYRARWTDLVVISLNHPPGPGPVDRLNSQFGQLLRRCPRPVLAVPRVSAGLRRLLLAYDGSPKANEALFVARYMVEKWDASLLVVTVKEKKGGGKKTSAQARAYLEEHNVLAEYLITKKFPSKTILETAADIDCDLIIMGGYGAAPISEIVSGSVVDEVLRTRNRPVLVCR